MMTRIHTTRGMALILVLIAIVVATLIGGTFLAQSENSANVGKRADERLQARLIAESGLTMAVKYIGQEPNWRTLQTSGQWINNQPLNNGAFSVWGQDGTGFDANGNIVGGDGNLTDNNSDSVILTSVGTYKNARYRVRAVIGAGSSSTIAASERIILKSNSTINSYSSSSGAPSATNETEAAVVTSNAAGQKNIKLSIGSKIRGTLYLPAGGRSSDAIQTFSPFILLNLLMDLFNIPLNVPVTDIVDKGVSNLTHDGYPIETVAMPAHAISSSNVKYTGNDSPTLNGDLVCRDLDIQGNAVITVTGPSRIICDGDFMMKNNTSIIIENPKFGNTTPYSSSQSGVGDKQIAIPVTLAKTVQLDSLAAYVKRSLVTRIRLAIYTDNANAPGALLAQSNDEYIDSGNYSWNELPVPAVTLNPGKYWIALSFSDNLGTYAYSAGGTAKVRNYDAVNNGFLANWGASDTTYNQNINLYLSGFVDGMGGSLQVFVAGNTTIEGKTELNKIKGRADRLTFYPLNPAENATLNIGGSAEVYGTIHGPGQILQISDAAKLQGKIRVSNLVMKEFAVFYVDTSDGLTYPGALIDENIVLNHFSAINAVSGNAIVACNSAGNPAIWLQSNSILKGNASSGPGDTPSVLVGSHATLTGTAGNLSSLVKLTMPTTPALPGNSNISYANAQLLNSSFKCSSLTLANNAVLTVDGDRSIVVAGNTLFQGNSQIILNANAKLTLYCQGSVAFSDTARINVAGDPSKVTINAYSSDRVTLQNSAHLTGTLHAENAEIRLLNTAQISGSVLSKRIYLESSSKLHYDKSGSGQMAWVEGQ